MSYAEDSTPEWMRSEGISCDRRTYERIMDRVKLWTEGRNPVEWACVLTGGVIKMVKGEPHQVVDDFYELPIYDVTRRQNYLSILVEDILRIHAIKKHIVGLVHTHPSGDLKPSTFDMYLFMHLDLQIGRPLKYVIFNPEGEHEVFDFQGLWDHGAFADLSKKVKADMKKARGGESAESDFEEEEEG